MNNSKGLQPLQNSLSGLPQWVSERITVPSKSISQLRANDRHYGQNRGGKIVIM
ncbi:hypothetical protein F152LOC_02137 [Pectobacterium brasiliense]|nr:hypothetical protein F152LOC_02137 [Pectobacterium brasiliense]